MAVVLVIAAGRSGTGAAGWHYNNPHGVDRSRPNPNGQRACTTPSDLCRIANGTPRADPATATSQMVSGLAALPGNGTGSFRPSMRSRLVCRLPSVRLWPTRRTFRTGSLSLPPQKK
jgi:hypothetical protein